MITSVRHMATVGSAYATGAARATAALRNEFTCIPHAVPFRPPRLTPKPIVQGVQTAIVVGPKGEEIHTDKYGRVKVQFHWDREGKNDEKSSCWIRVAQAWAGKRWGAMFLPRIGQEVIVDFLEGDPDQPIIIGRVYNAEHMPPYALPGEQTQEHASRPTARRAAVGFNEIRFEDKKGSEQVFVHAERQQDIRVKRDALEWVGRDRHLIVERDQREEVKRNKHLTVKGDHNEQIDGTLSLKVGMDLDQKVGMKMAEDAGMEIHLKGGMNVVLEGGMTVTLKAGAGFVVVGPTGVAISGTPILINTAVQPARIRAPHSRRRSGARSRHGQAGRDGLCPAQDRLAAGDRIAAGGQTGMPFSEKWAPAARQAALARGATPQEANEAAQEAGQAGAAAATEKTWVEIEMVDQDFKPVAGEAYVIVLPDGTRRTGTLDAAGRARIDDIDPGACDVSFPNIDGGEWKRL